MTNRNDQKTPEDWAVQFSMNVGADTTDSKGLADEAFLAIHRLLKPFIFYRACRLTAMTADPRSAFDDLCSVGTRSAFQNLLRWHPSQKRAFSMKTMRLNIGSKMVDWLNHENRLIRYPDRLVMDILALNRTMSDDEAEGFLEEVSCTWSRQRVKAVQQFRDAIRPASAAVIPEDAPEEEQGKPLDHGLYVSGNPWNNIAEAEVLISSAMEGLTESQRSCTVRPPFTQPKFSKRYAGAV